MVRNGSTVYTGFPVRSSICLEGYTERDEVAGTLNHPKFMYQEHPLMAKEDLHRCCNVKNQGIKAQMYCVLLDYTSP